MVAGGAALSVLVFAVCEDRLNAGRAYAFAAAAAAAAVAAFFTTRAVLSGLARPMGKMSAGVKSFIAADYKLDSALPKEGWTEAQGVISVLNRLMLELSAYRAFHLNQVVEERAKAQALIETINDGILLVDDRGRLIYSNQLALKLLGIPIREPDITLPGSVKQEAFASAISGIIASSENYLKARWRFPSRAIRSRACEAE